MKYQFFSTFNSEQHDKKINIPFNVWEICDSQGVLPVEVTVNQLSFHCNLEPLGKGFYNIPISAEIESQIMSSASLDVSFSFIEETSHLNGTSPYSLENPIRQITNMNLISQPNDGLCGQSCIAMLAGVSLDDACEIMHCKEWQASMGKMIDTLDYLGLSHEDVIHYTQGITVALPKCAILMEKMGRYSHYLVYYNQVYYDPTIGVLEDFDQANMVGYLAINTIS